jgi:hypothetical protein
MFIGGIDLVIMCLQRDRVTCPGINQISVEVKVNQPNVTSMGTVVCESGGARVPDGAEKIADDIISFCRLSNLVD